MRWSAAAGLLAIALAWAPVCRGQTREELARADALFNAAKALSASGQYVDACAKFAESKRLVPGLGVSLYLADCYERIGRTASAWTEFRAAEGLARERKDSRADVARQHAQALETGLVRLTIVVAPTVPRAGLSVLRDGHPVSEDELGIPVPVDPGDHAVVVSAPGHPHRTFEAHLGPDNRSATVKIDSLEVPAATPAPAPARPPAPAPALVTEPARASKPVSPQAPPADPGRTWRTLGLVTMGLGVASVGVGTVFALLAKSRLDASNAGPCDPTNHCTDAGLSDRKDALDKAAISTATFAAGGAVLAGGLVMFLAAPRATPTTGLVLEPAQVGSGAGALLRGAF